MSCRHSGPRQRPIRPATRSTVQRSKSVSSSVTLITNKFNLLESTPKGSRCKHIYSCALIICGGLKLFGPRDNTAGSGQPDLISGACVPGRRKVPCVTFRFNSSVSPPPHTRFVKASRGYSHCHPGCAGGAQNIVIVGAGRYRDVELDYPAGGSSRISKPLACGPGLAMSISILTARCGGRPGSPAASFARYSFGE